MTMITRRPKEDTGWTDPSPPSDSGSVHDGRERERERASVCERKKEVKIPVCVRARGFALFRAQRVLAARFPVERGEPTGIPMHGALRFTRRPRCRHHATCFSPYAEWRTRLIGQLRYRSCCRWTLSQDAHVVMAHGYSPKVGGDCVRLCLSFFL